MVEAKKSGMLNVFVTNGYMTRDMLDDSKGLIDAANVDLKAFNDRFYLHYCKARREGVTGHAPGHERTGNMVGSDNASHPYAE